MNEPPIRNDDIAFGKGCAIEALAARLIGQLDKAETLGWQVECNEDARDR
jgi:hypothetical protein